MTDELYGIAAAIIIFVGTFIKIPKLELNVWSLIGKMINSTMEKKLDEVIQRQKETDEKLEKHIKADDERYIVDCRSRILCFNDGLLHGTNATKEHFDQVLFDISKYDRYCDDNPDFQNQMTVCASENIKRRYNSNMENSSFL